MDSQQRPVISKSRSDTQGTTSTTTELTISGFPRICKSTLHFVASVVRIPRACGSSSRIRLPPDAFGARPGRTLPDCRDELRHFLPPAALSRARRSLRRFEWTPNSGFRLSRPSVGRTAFKWYRNPAVACGDLTNTCKPMETSSEGDFCDDFVTCEGGRRDAGERGRRSCDRRPLREGLGSRAAVRAEPDGGTDHRVA